MATFAAEELSGCWCCLLRRWAIQGECRWSPQVRAAALIPRGEQQKIMGVRSQEGWKQHDEEVCRARGMEVKEGRDPRTDVEVSRLGKSDRESGSMMHSGVGGGLRYVA